jgi:NAD(P)-dependent dehydrogenase (short-subunit alcohol dehydrogenase family)
MSQTASTPSPTATAPTLSGKVALVTGAARGIGKAVATKLAAAGCDVVVNYYNSQAEAEALCEQFRALGRRAVAIQASVSQPDSVDEMFTELRKHFDHLDIVVSNAASGVLKPALEMSLKHWRWCMETNAFALNLLAQRAAPLLRPGGRIIAMSSLGSVRAMPNYAFIGASKAALESLVRSLAQEMGRERRARERGQRRRGRHRRAGVLSQPRAGARRRSARAPRPARCSPPTTSPAPCTCCACPKPA